MSSILKALKRVEEETAETGGQPVTAKKDGVLEKTIPEPVEKLLIFGGKVVILCMGGWALFWLFTYFNLDISPSPKPMLPPAGPVHMAVPFPPAYEEAPYLAQKDPIPATEIKQAPLEQPIDERIPDQNPSMVPDEDAGEAPIAPSPRQTDYEKIVDSNWLSLQALSWEDDPKRRIAVINGKIVKEGSMVDRGTVVRIRPDAVIIQSQGKSYLLQFQNR